MYSLTIVCFNLAMNLLRNSIFTSLIFVLSVETILSKEIWLYNYFEKSALPVIQNRDLSLQLAIPEKYNSNYVSYVYDDGIVPNVSTRVIFMLACPATESDSYNPTAEMRLKINAELSSDSELLFMREYEPQRPVSTCFTKIVPTIKRKKKKISDGNLEYCGHYKAEMYHVGYPVMREHKKDVQFVPIYDICYSEEEGKGVQYTVHNIASPNLALLEIWDYFELNPNVSSLRYPLETDETETNEQKRTLEYDMQEYFAYQLVGLDDMPIKSWKRTTLFLFNFTLIPKNKNVVEGMIAADNYIRLFSRKTNKPLRLYSGVYEKRLKIPHLLCFLPYCKPGVKTVHSFWRIIMDQQRYALIVVTQHTQVKCAFNYICHQNRNLVLRYENGGCAYTCSVDKRVLKKLGLPPIEISGVLDLTFPDKVPSNEETSLQNGLSKQPPSTTIKPIEYFSISDFLGKGTFSEVLKKIDPDLVSEIKIREDPQRPPDW